MRLIRPVTIASLFISLVIADNISACSCGRTSVEDAYSSANIVFLGEVVKVRKNVSSLGRWIREVIGQPYDDSIYRMNVTFQVKKSWKAVASKSILVHTPDPEVCCICGYYFEVGKSYVVYGYGSPPSTSICTRTKLLSEAGTEITKLDLLKRDLEKKKK